MDRVYKTMTGWRDEDEKHPATHIHMTTHEYENMRKALENERRSAAYYKRQVEEVKQSAEENAMQKAKKAFQEYASKLRAEEKKSSDEKMQKVIDEKEALKKQNENLMRMYRERSNADRKLQPKQKHTGYVVMQSQEKEVRYARKRKTHSYTAWETTLQTPYTVDCTMNEVLDLVYADVYSAELVSMGILGQIGITDVTNSGLVKLLDHETEPDEAEYDEDGYEIFRPKVRENAAFEQRFRANYRTGYWEVIYTHLRPLSRVPKNMRQ